MVPFKKDNYKIKHDIERYWIFRSSIGINPSGMFIFSNLKKIYNCKVYFNEDMRREKGEGYEDYDLVLELKEMNIPCHICSQIIVNNPFFNLSTTFQNNERERKSSSYEHM